MSTRRYYSAETKAEILAELATGQKRLAQIASEHRVHPEAVGKWKYPQNRAAKNEPIPANSAEIKRLKEKHEKEKDQLYREIGKLTTEINWLKKSFRV
jgi:transposase-like protein